MEAIAHSIRVAKTARYYQLGTLDATTKRIWFVLHGYGQLASYFIQHFESLVAHPGTCVIAPEGLSRFYLDGKWDRIGATWMTKEDRLHEIEDYLAYLDHLLDSTVGTLPQAPEIVLLGFSQGTATAWRWVMKGNIRPQRLILWAGNVATDAMEKAAERLEGCELHFVLGDADEYIRLPEAEKLLLTVRSIKPDAQLWTFEGNHRMDATILRDLAGS